MENSKDPKDMFNGVDDLTKLEGIRDFFKEQIYGDVFKYIRDNHLLQNPDDPICTTAYDLIAMADALPEVYLNKDIQPEEKNRILSEGIGRMNEKLLTIKETINPPEENAAHKTMGGSNGN